ncbi:MAG: right-handed parallel beta-helix repeat-containing protein [Deltaproteobacteria bacterium]|nr:right-handed parallel beta-helix repeat-containing protein [Deltaproteobacteria bacterium]
MNAALSGDSIRIQAGLYTKQVLISRKNNTAGATEADRILIEADPAAAPGSVMLKGPSTPCPLGDVVLVQKSKFITVRGLTITGAGGHAIVLDKGGKHNQAIHLERNRIFDNGGSLCDGGITIGAGNIGTLIVNNVIYGNYGSGVTLTGAKGGPHYLVNNTIHGNGHDGVSISKNHQVILNNNLLTLNGTDSAQPSAFGVERRAPSKRTQPQTVQLLQNLVCGNRSGELKGVLLDSVDAGNLTPSGSEGPGVSASPGCGVAGTVYAQVTGADGIANTADDDFSLAAGSPAVDTGMDPRTLGPGAAFDLLFTADVTKEGARPRDGDKNNTAEFDRGAVEKPGECEPGASKSCYTGPAGTAGVGQCKTGTQTCGAGGDFGACIGQVLPGTEIPNNGIDEDCNGRDAQCTPGATQSCYTGPAGTAGVGICRTGTQTCGANGTFGTCSGQVLPGTEIPNNGIDENCDGHDAECSPGTTQSCYDGPPGTQGVGQCKAGTRTCGADGTFGTCVGEVVPGTEIPGNGIDEDCNGSDQPGGGGPLPPDPATVAPPVDQSVATSLATATAFLYTGSNPIQTGVDPGTIDARRVAVLRGTVLDKSNTPLPGVTITILNHPEFGQTLSRADGMFDLAVNGGGLLTVNYAKAGLLSAQRQVQVPWNDYAWLPEVVLIPYDAHSTLIDLTAPTFQVARGSVITDARGTRQASVLFASGTQATMHLPDGSTQPLTTLHVRATEHSVGANGPAAVTAEEPATVAYPYGVDFSADEAVAANALSVDFSQPVILYVENFIGFPVGGGVPLGGYDQQQGLWVPHPNGRVVQVMSVTNGQASLDITGSGQATSPVDLAALGITDAELQVVGRLYVAGQKLWRVAIPHFTYWDT